MPFGIRLSNVNLLLLMTVNISCTCMKTYDGLTKCNNSLLVPPWFIIFFNFFACSFCFVFCFCFCFVFVFLFVFVLLLLLSIFPPYFKWSYFTIIWLNYSTFQSHNKILRAPVWWMTVVAYTGGHMTKCVSHVCLQLTA